jgi:hypothetical protein
METAVLSLVDLRVVPLRDFDLAHLSMQYFTNQIRASDHRPTSVPGESSLGRRRCCRLTDRHLTDSSQKVQSSHQC